jgi:hypothetical protein
MAEYGSKALWYRTQIVDTWLSSTFAVKCVWGSGGQDGFRLLSRYFLFFKWRLLTAKARVPTLSARPLIMAPRYSDPKLLKEILSYQFAKVGHCGQGISLVMPNLDYLNLWELNWYSHFGHSEKHVIIK